MMRWFALCLLAALALGCAEGSKEASGDTRALAEEVPKSKPGAPHFTPPGNSLLKGETPDKVDGSAKSPDFKGTPGKRSGG
jgi:hypothetical protein